MTGADPDLRLDTAQVAEVVAFCRTSQMIATAAAADLRDHDFGRWAGADADEHYGDLRRRYARLATTLADRIDRDGADAAELGDRLRSAVTAVTRPDDDAAAGIAAVARRSDTEA